MSSAPVVETLLSHCEFGIVLGVVATVATAWMLRAYRCELAVVFSGTREPSPKPQIGLLGEYREASKQFVFSLTGPVAQRNRVTHIFFTPYVVPNVATIPTEHRHMCVALTADRGAADRNNTVCITTTAVEYPGNMWICCIDSSYRVLPCRWSHLTAVNGMHNSTDAVLGCLVKMHDVLVRPLLSRPQPTAR
jgi:hypothetical protein